MTQKRYHSRDPETQVEKTNKTTNPSTHGHLHNYIASPEPHPLHHFPRKEFQGETETHLGASLIRTFVSTETATFASPRNLDSVTRDVAPVI